MMVGITHIYWLDGDSSGDVRMCLVIDYFKVVEFVIKDRIRFPLYY
jgi:hypothetical protein